MMKLKKIPATDKNLLLPLFEDYLIELSQYLDNIKFDENARPLYKWYHHYWKERERTPYYAVVNKERVGFAFVRKTRENTVEIAEFAIFPAYRKHKYGKTFATLIIDKCNCDIEISAGLKNMPAIAFWDSFTKNYKHCQITYDEKWKNYFIHLKKL